jgi:hypothetical protein
VLATEHIIYIYFVITLAVRFICTRAGEKRKLFCKRLIAGGFVRFANVLELVGGLLPSTHLSVNLHTLCQFPKTLR